MNLVNRVTELLTGRLLLFVTSNGAGNRVVLALEAIRCTLDFALHFGGLDLGLAGGVHLRIPTNMIERR